MGEAVEAIVNASVSPYSVATGGGIASLARAVNNGMTAEEEAIWDAGD